MPFDFLIFGGTGQQGRICARDLLDSGHSVLLAGRDPGGIRDLLRRKQAGFLSIDLRNEKAIATEIRRSGAAVVVNCAELVFNIPIMKACLATGRSCTDLGGLQHVTRQQFKLDSAFRAKGLVTITGCGSTPGIANVMAAHAVDQLDAVDTITLGFAWDSSLKVFVVPYSMQSIFEELTEPPVLLRNGKFVKGTPGRCYGSFDFKEVGRQTVYCIVHSEVYTFARYFKRKGLRNVDYMAGFPEHSLRPIRTLIDLGFHSATPLEIGGCRISPLDVAIRALKRLPVPRGYREVENLWVRVDGRRGRRRVTTEMNCIIKTVKGWESAGSNVDTGRTISIMSQMLKRGQIQQAGVHAPEAVVPRAPFFEELAKRSMHVYHDGVRIN